jgi:hypothetical protein
VKRSARSLVAAIALAFLSLLPVTAYAQSGPLPVADVLQESNSGSQLAQQITQTTNIIEQVKTMISDHIPLSQILQGQGTTLIAQIGKNNSILTSGMKIDTTVLADFQKIAPSYTGGTSYLNYLATLKRNADQQYASSLSMTQDQLQQEGGVAAAAANVANVRATNQLQALQQIVGLGQLQTSQMDSLIKIQAAMLKSMTTYYGTSKNQLDAPVYSALAEAARMSCLANVPGYAALQGAQKAAATQACQNNLKQATQTQQQ